MALLRVAILPSLQDGNAFVDFNGRRTNEMAQVAIFAIKLANLWRSEYAFAGVEALVISGAPQSKNTYHLQSLHEQQQRAYAYLNEPGSGNTLALNLHTDSGDNSTDLGRPGHVGGYWDGASVDSFKIADDLRRAIAPVFHTTKILGLDYGAQEYVFAEEMYRKHRACLIEMGSHQNYSDEEVICNHGDAVARAIIVAVSKHFGLPTSGYTAETTCPNGQGMPQAIGDGFARWLNAHPNEGKPRLIHSDPWGNTMLYLTLSGAHPEGGVLWWRSSTGLHLLDL
jgi:hypothetical protein